MTPSEELINRYTRVERETDAFGRVIGVRKLRISQQTKVSEMTPGLEGDAEVFIRDDLTGEESKIRISRRSQMMLAAAVMEIDGNPYPFPTTRGQLDAVADRLDEEGLLAAMIAYSRFQPQRAEGEEAPDTIEQAKKSQATHSHEHASP